MTTPDAEVAVAGRGGVFSASRYVVLPRSRWGLATWGIYHECDLLALSRSGALHEIEIKVSRSDLLADAKKAHAHDSAAISRLWYAVPKEMVDFAKENIPLESGLIRCCEMGGGRLASFVVRRPKTKKAPKASPELIAHIHELIACRYWSEREKEAKE